MAEIYNDSVGSGYGGYGFGGIAPVGLIGLNSVLGGYGYDRGNLDTESFLKGQAFGQGAKYEDVVNATSTINDTTRDSFNSLRTQNEYLASISNSNQKELVQLMFNAERQAADCCCETKQLIMAENAKTRDLITENKIESLQAALSDEKTARQFAERGLLTATGPSMAVIPNKCDSGDTAKIAQLEQTIVNIGGQVNSILTALQNTK